VLRAHHLQLEAWAVSVRPLRRCPNPITHTCLSAGLFGLPGNGQALRKEAMPEPHPGAINTTPASARNRKTKPNNSQTNNTTDNHSADAETTTETPTGQVTSEEPTMTTTTKPAEPTAAELSRRALAQEKATHAQALTLNDQCQTATEELSAFLASGQASLSDFANHKGRWLDVHAAQDVAALLVTGCENNVKRAERALINDDTTVAELFANVLADVYGGELLVQVVTIKADTKPNDDGSPVLFIVQEKAGVNKAGILSAKLFLTYYRGALHQGSCKVVGRGAELRVWGGHGPVVI
jgi:hypothetical protein